MDNEKNPNISNYCETCAFLCKCNKEYCPNHMSSYEAKRMTRKMEMERFRRINEMYQRKNDKNKNINKEE